MEELKDQPITIQEYRERVKKKTCNVKELAQILEISEAKARRIAHIEGAPVLRFGRDIRFVLSKLDNFLEDHIGDIL
ncbi:excisionase [Clostridium baratii]|uniref:excisionase n=1 Tax=Clostridium baratii TaxID=1561 RepID=UPI0006C1E363|nr:excisionase [Clostridium baratii]OPF52520.1 excisionase [Clostridium baratii]OPF55968.1 excisionase [Clostridium baratii]OPF58438.1 excisionase [Clostridium baratii]OPF59650.1 excisionase [Clostridium baratii]CUP24854.1 Helix-turn-helix domain [Clostridium baratii]